MAQTQKTALAGVELDLTEEKLVGVMLVPTSILPELQARNYRNDADKVEDYALNGIYDSASAVNDIQLTGVIPCHVDKVLVGAGFGPVVVICETY